MIDSYIMEISNGLKRVKAADKQTFLIFFHIYLVNILTNQTLTFSGEKGQTL